MAGRVFTTPTSMFSKKMWYGTSPSAKIITLSTFHW